ncbi:MAG: hypothetical protein R2726_01490 [Acidimicrobiales bacterium]
MDRGGIAALIDRADGDQVATARSALLAAMVLLSPDEAVLSLVLGTYHGRPAVGLLTSTRVLLVNDHEWLPDQRSIPLAADLEVRGLQDDRAASLTFLTEGVGVTIADIVDRPSAHDLARELRSRVADLADP